MVKQHKKETLGHFIRRYIFISIGVVLTAVALDLFLIPNSVIDGGIIGIALILNFLTGMPFGILILILNLPFLFFGYKHIGKSFFITSWYAIALLAIVEFPLKKSDRLLPTRFLQRYSAVCFSVQASGRLSATGGRSTARKFSGFY